MLCLLALDPLLLHYRFLSNSETKANSLRPRKRQSDPSEKALVLCVDSLASLYQTPIMLSTLSIRSICIGLALAQRPFVNKQARYSHHRTIDFSSYDADSKTPLSFLIEHGLSLTDQDGSLVEIRDGTLTLYNLYDEAMLQQVEGRVALLEPASDLWVETIVQGALDSCMFLFIYLFTIADYPIQAIYTTSIYNSVLLHLAAGRVHLVYLQTLTEASFPILHNIPTSKLEQQV